MKLHPLVRVDEASIQPNGQQRDCRGAVMGKTAPEVYSQKQDSLVQEQWSYEAHANRMNGGISEQVA